MSSTDRTLTAAAKPQLVESHDDGVGSLLAAPSITSMGDFHLVFAELIAQWGGTKSTLARKLNISPSRLSRLLLPGPANLPSTELCLRIADVFGVSASRILRAADKAKIAEKIEDLYGGPRRQAKAAPPAGISQADMDYLAETWRALHSDDRALLRRFMERLKRLHEHSPAVDPPHEPRRRQGT